jgi:tripartite-type tricarboxylate transporter receptor subunit TctC
MTLRFPRRQFLHLVTGSVALTASRHLAIAQVYPERTVRVIVPFAPGGTTDIFTRIAAQKLSERLGRQFVVENVGGASGNIGTG